MAWEELVARCMAKPGAWEDEPWEGDTVVKVGNKIFAFVGSPSAGHTARIGLKCAGTREEANEWIDRYPDDAQVMPYIGRFGWNTLTVGGAIPDAELEDAVDASYEAVVSRLPKKERP
jgi:predicted DNA-binding protein (MmcQ/YjbR family)